MYILTSEAAFDAAHFLYGYEGKCRNLHGHRWRVVAEIANDSLVDEGQCRDMVVDFGDVKSVLKAEADRLDHALIYEEGSLKPTTVAALEDEGFRLVVVDFRPTAEALARYFYQRLAQAGLSVHGVTVYETPTNAATYREVM